MISKKDFKKISDWLWEIPKDFRKDMRVPARVYLSEKMLEEIFRDESIPQLINGCTLPGIQKYGIAMPDCHEGYSVPIGFVGAIRTSDGIISPGACGFDINCLSPKTKVLLENGVWINIGELENFWKKTKVKFVDFLKKDLDDSKIIYFLKRYNNPTIYRVVTESGEVIEATEDHPLQTKEGMKEVRFLKEGDFVLIYPFKGVKYQKPSSKIILSEESYKRILKRFGKTEKGNAFSQIFNQIKSRNLLPLTYDHPSLPYILKLMGYIFGDGSISFDKNGGAQIQFYGNPDDLSEIQRDIVKLGFKAPQIYSRKRNHTITTFYRTYKFSRTEYSLRICSFGLAVLFIALGTPYGLKSHKAYRVPKWIFKCPLWQKRLFLAAFFGAELSGPSTLNKYNFYAPQLNMQKVKGLERNARLFLKDIANLLKEFGIKTYPIKEVPGYQYRGKKGETVGFRLQIAEDAQNLIKFFEVINYEYNPGKQKNACLAANYLRRKLKIVEMRDRARREIKKLYRKKGDFKKFAPQILEKYKSEYITLQFLYHSLFKENSHGIIKKRGNPRIAFNFPSFTEYKNEYSFGEKGLVWERIEKIEKIPYQNFVYDFTINDINHNFIANSFVVSNCGIKLLKSEYSEKEIKPYLEKLATEIQKEVPSGLGRGRQIKLSIEQIDKILKGGAKYLVEQGYGEKEDIENCEANGCLEWADPRAVSNHAKNRGRDQVGTLGSGNHFLEIQKVAEIFDERVAKVFGLFKDQIVIMVHCGSRGLGHQVCSDYLREFIPLMLNKYKIKVPDREFACVPFNSPEGQRYFSAMAAAANYAWANRQMIAHFIRKAWKSVFGEKASSLIALYDVAHNIIKKEKYIIDGKEVEVAVHRKGATRAFPPGHPEIPEKYREVGQPVIIPGSMGTASYVLVGTREGEEAFYSTCFTGETKILTNKGIFTFKEVYEKIKKDKMELLVPSLNENSYQFEWKPIIDAMKREAPVIEIAISQRGKSRKNTLRVTPDHKFITLSGSKFVKKEISKILNEREMVLLADQLPAYDLQFVDPQLAYLVGAIITDGYVYPGSGKGKYPYNGRKIIFIQKKEPAKLNFISYVQFVFQNIFHTPLREYRTKIGRSFIRGRVVEGVATDFVCTQAQPIQQLLLIQENLVTWVLSLPEEATFNFLAGVIDGDGTWHSNRKIIDIFSEEKKAPAIIIACLKLGILPYVSIQRGNCYIIQISEKIDEITRYTKRVKSEIHLRKYGTKLFSVRQLFNEVKDLRWPFSQKFKRNNLMSKEIIEKFLFKEKENLERRFKIKREKYESVLANIKKIISSPLRMQRVEKIRNLGVQEVFNITVKDNHNYIVLTDLFSPVLVANCHGAGRTMSRHAAIRSLSGKEIISNLEKKGIIVKCYSLKGIAEEAPQAYKNVDEVVEVVHKAGLSKKVAKLVPLAVIKGE